MLACELCPEYWYCKQTRTKTDATGTTTNTVALEKTLTTRTGRNPAAVPALTAITMATPVATGEVPVLLRLLLPPTDSHGVLRTSIISSSIIFGIAAGMQHNKVHPEHDPNPKPLNPCHALRARLSLGMNLSNLFVFHFIAGFYLQEPSPDQAYRYAFGRGFPFHHP